MDYFLNFGSLASAVIFLAAGLLAYALLLKPLVSIILRLFRREIVEEKNVALAIVVGFVSLSLAIIVAAAVH